jgi:predicted DNA binding protein
MVDAQRCAAYTLFHVQRSAKKGLKMIDMGQADRTLRAAQNAADIATLSTQTRARARAYCEEQTASEVMEIAHKFAICDSSRLCIADANACFKSGRFEYAAKRALKSLAYSLGIMAPAYVAQRDAIRAQWPGK